MLNAFIKFGDGKIVSTTEVKDIEAAYRDTSACFWLDLPAPGEPEYALLKDLFGFHPLAVEDVMVEVQRPKLESYALVGDSQKAEYFFLVIHSPDLDPDPETLFQTSELDIFFSERYLITTHDEPVLSINEMHARVQADPASSLLQGIDILLYELLDRLVDKYSPILDDFQESLDQLEEAATENPSQEFLVTISARKTELLHLRRIMTQQRDVLGQLTRGEVAFVRELSRIYFRDILDHLQREVETIDIYRDLLMGCRDIYMSSINNQLNKIMKTLAIISVVTLPLTVITSFFGMNFADTVPGFTRPFTFAIASLAMIFLPIVLLLLFRKKDWL
jgi:magnesium transporter